MQTKKYSGFRGINTISSPDALPEGDLYDAVGVISDRKGRLTSCWEGPTAPKLNGTDMQFQYLDGNGVSRPPDFLYHWKQGKKVFGANELVAGFNGESTSPLKTQVSANYNSATTYSVGERVLPSEWSAAQSIALNDVRVPTDSDVTGLFYKAGGAGTTGSTEPDWPTTLGDTVTDNGITWTAVEAFVYVQTSNTSETAAGDEPAWPTTLGDTVAGAAGGVVWRAERPWKQKSWAVEFNDYLIICAEDEPMRAIHKDTPLTGLSVNGTLGPDTTNHGNFRFEYQTYYRALYPYHKYYSKGSMITTIDTNRTKASPLTDADWIDQPDSPGYGFGNDFHTWGHTFSRYNDYSYDSLPKKGYCWYVDRAGEVAYLTTANQDYTNDNFTRSSGSAYRIGMPGQIVKMRFPTVWQGRLIGVEGRRYEYSRVNLGVNQTLDYVSTTTAHINSYDAKDEVSVGDELCVFRNSTADSGTGRNSLVCDYELASYDTLVYEITNGVLTAGDTVLTLSNGDAGGSIQNFGSARDFAIRRKLSNAERRTIMVSGRPEDPARGTEEDPNDFLYFAPQNRLEIGTDEDGDITCLFPVNDQVLLVGCERAIYLVQWELPLSRMTQAQVSKIADIGIVSDRAIVKGQQIYFAGSDDRLYALAEMVPQLIDHKIYNHYGRIKTSSSGTVQAKRHSYTHLAYCDERLYAKSSGDQPYIYIYDELTQGFTATVRRNCGQDQGQSAEVLVPGAAGYTSAFGSNTLEATNMNLLHPAKQPGGVFSPFNSSDDMDNMILVFSYITSDHYGHTLNYKPDITAKASLLHGGRIVMPMASFDDLGLSQPRRVRWVNTRVMHKVDSTAFNTIPVGFISDTYDDTLTDSTWHYEQETANDKALPAETSEASGRWQSFRYNVESQQIRHWARSLCIGDRACPIGEISIVEVDYHLRPWRRRVA